MDLLKTFECEGGCLKQEPAVDEEEKVELSLGLSLNGRFGVERRRLETNNDTRLIRASSYPVVKKEDETTLKRTCSAVDWKRKGLAIEGNCEMKKRKLVREVGSPASAGSSGVSDLETQPFSGLTKETESKSTASQQSVLHSIASERSSAQKIINENQWKDETLKMMLSDMPSVSTKQNGVDGKKIQGFLYRYRKGEQVRIVCVCHGSFLTPAEFVKHGGGGDVEHPLRHIVVNPTSL